MDIAPIAEQNDVERFGVRLAWCREKLTGFAAYHDSVLKAKADEIAYRERFGVVRPGGGE